MLRFSLMCLLKKDNNYALNYEKEEYLKNMLFKIMNINNSKTE